MDTARLHPLIGIRIPTRPAGGREMKEKEREREGKREAEKQLMNAMGKVSLLVCILTTTKNLHKKNISV